MVRHSPSPWSERFAISLLVDFLASFLSRLSFPFPIGISVDGAAVMSYSHRSLHQHNTKGARIERSSSSSLPHKGWSATCSSPLCAVTRMTGVPVRYEPTRQYQFGSFDQFG